MAHRYSQGFARAERKRFSLAFSSRPLHAVAIIRAAGGVVDILLAATSEANEA
jgi:hypothetical protein